MLNRLINVILSKHIFRAGRKLLSCLLLALLAIFSQAAKAGEINLEQGFASPPDSAKPRVYWWWLFNRVDKEGITRDLEQFKAKGISGVNMICTGGYAGAEPLPGVKYQSAEWWELFRHAIREAKRLDIEFGFNLSAGGWVMEAPWVTPDMAMKKVVQANVNVEGPKKFSDKLPQPETVESYYHDYCVQAFPHKGAGVINPEDVIDLTDKLHPDGRLEWTVPEGQWTILRTGYTLTGHPWSRWHVYPAGDTFEGGDGYEIDYLSSAALDDHFEHLGQPILKAVRQAGGRLAYLWSDSWECGKLTWTQDFPKQFRKFRGYDLNPYLPALPGAISYADYTATFTATSDTHTLCFVGTNLTGGDNTVFIDNVQIKANGVPLNLSNFGFETPSLGVGKIQYNPTGGSWTFGGSPGNGSGIVANGSGFNNPNVPQGGQAAFVQGLGDFSQAISGFVPGTKYTITFSAALRPGNAQTWSVKIDNTAIGNYTPKTGATLVNDEVTARFRADFDRTIQDCIADNFYGRFAELCHQNGMMMGSEAGGPNDIPPQDTLRNLGRCDIPAGEFWASFNSPGGFNSDRGARLNLKQTASAAHLYGKREAQAESFTQMEADRTHWSIGPAALKPFSNDAFCEGINRIMLHQATCQPPSDGKPGYEFCAGQHWNPNMTWWEQSPAFFTYLSRCSYMLQQGNFIGDVCFYLGEEPPVLAPPKYVDPALGAGYDCDYSNAEALLTRMSVKGGRIVLPDGVSYRLLVLQNCTSTSPEICRQVGGYQQLPVSPTPSKAMSIEVVEKIRELVRKGATVVGAPPEKAAELKNYPGCDEQVRKIAAEVWGDLDGKTRTERRFGEGRVIWGKSPKEILLAEGVKPDFTFTGQAEQSDGLDFIHRTLGETEIYFVANRKNQPETRDCTFRVAGKQPEIWDPVSGNIRTATAFRQADGCATLPLEFAPFESYFIVFRQAIAAESVGKAEHNFPQLATVQNLAGPWTVAFDPQWGGPASAEFAELTSWIKRVEEGIKFYSGKATYRKTFDMGDVADAAKGNVTDAAKGTGQNAKRLFIDLGDVREVAEVRLNGKKLGVLWSAPWRVEITDCVKPSGNVLEIDVINLWANRVIGDLNQPKEKRFTKTHEVFRFNMLTKDTQPIDSGLLGPVHVLREENTGGKAVE